MPLSDKHEMDEFISCIRICDSAVGKAVGQLRRLALGKLDLRVLDFIFMGEPVEAES